MTEREPRSLRWDSNAWLWVLRDSDHWQIALQITDPSSRQRGRPKAKGKAIFRQKKGKNEIWSWAPKGCQTPRPTDWLTVSRKVTSTSTIIILDLSTVFDVKRNFSETAYCLRLQVVRREPQQRSQRRRSSFLVVQFCLPCLATVYTCSLRAAGSNGRCLFVRWSLPSNGCMPHSPE
jgi:hypothetical protein